VKSCEYRVNSAWILYLKVYVIVTSYDFLYLEISVSCDVFRIVDIEVLVPCEYLVSFWSFGLREFLAMSYVAQNAL
jgi:hypothetical protein